MLIDGIVVINLSFLLNYIQQQYCGVRLLFVYQKFHSQIKLHSLGPLHAFPI